MMSNSDNPKNGADFQKKVRTWFEKKYNLNDDETTNVSECYNEL